MAQSQHLPSPSWADNRPALRKVFSFPKRVNEKAARAVATMVVALSVTIIVSGQLWLTALLAYGFLARVLTGPTLSLMGLLATRVVAPRLGPPRIVPGPPKRFAQAVGLAFSTAALILHFAAGASLAASVVLAVLVLFASLEAFVGFCAGCFVFDRLMRWGLIPQSVCEECASGVPEVG